MNILYAQSVVTERDNLDLLIRKLDDEEVSIVAEYVANLLLIRAGGGDRGARPDQGCWIK